VGRHVFSLGWIGKGYWLSQRWQGAQLQKPRHEIIRGVEDKALRWLRTFIPFARKSLAASTRKAERGAFATINMNYVYWLRVYVTVREPVIQQAKQSLILIPCMNVLTQ
jgi:hypothetical protein